MKGTHMTEIWQRIPGFEKYEVSTEGRIRGSWRGGNILSQRITPFGYKTVCLYKNPKEKIYPFVHRLVAWSFIPNPENKEHVHHKDFDKTNNRVENLEWVTKEENVQRDWKSGRRCHKGEKHPMADSSEKEIIEVRKYFDKGLMTQKEISHMMGWDFRRTHLVVRRKTWKHI